MVNKNFLVNQGFKKPKKAQSSMEFLILMGFLTLVIIVIVGMGFYYSSTIKDRIKLSQSSNFANKIASTTETVFYAGEPSRATISAHLPEGVSSIQIIENSIVITQNLETGINIKAYHSNVPIAQNSSATLTTLPGIKNIVVVANETHAIISEN